MARPSAKLMRMAAVMDDDLLLLLNAHVTP
jgi:hypothetical protein